MWCVSEKMGTLVDLSAFTMLKMRKHPNSGEVSLIGVTAERYSDAQGGEPFFLDRQIHLFPNSDAATACLQDMAEEINGINRTEAFNFDVYD